MKKDILLMELAFTKRKGDLFERIYGKHKNVKMIYNKATGDLDIEVTIDGVSEIVPLQLLNIYKQMLQKGE